MQRRPRRKVRNVHLLAADGVHRKKGHTIHTNLNFRHQQGKRLPKANHERSIPNAHTALQFIRTHAAKFLPWTHSQAERSLPPLRACIVPQVVHTIYCTIFAYRWQKATEARWKQRSSRSLLSRPTSKVKPEESTWNRYVELDLVDHSASRGERKERRRQMLESQGKRNENLPHTHPSNPTEQHLMTRQYTRHERGRGRSKHVVALHQSERAEGGRVKPAGHVKALG